MAKRQLEAWGLRFGISVNAAGYAWQRPPAGGDEVLAPVGSLPEPGADVWDVPSMGERRERLGLDVAREAFNRFRALAEVITRAECAPCGLVRATVSNEECRERIVDFAGKFGPLWGDDDPRTLRAWRQEAADFLDLYDVRRALQTADYMQFRRCVAEPTPAWPGMTYRSARGGVVRYRSRLLVIAEAGESLRGRNAPNAVAESIDLLDRAQAASTPDRARMLLSRVTTAKLAGGLSLQVAVLTGSLAFVTPRHLVHLLYARMWLDTVDVPAIERQVTCRACGAPISGTRRKQFCDDRCRTTYHNARRAPAGTSN